jgi:hypothetical protein
VQESGVQAVQVESVAMLILTGHFIDVIHPPKYFYRKIRNREDVTQRNIISRILYKVRSNTSAVQQLHQKAPKVQIRLQTAQLDDIERGISEGRFRSSLRLLCSRSRNRLSDTNSSSVA